MRRELRMKRAAVIGAVAVLALVGAWQASAVQPEATGPVFEAREEARCEGALWPSAEETVFANAASAEVTCEDFGFFDAGKKKECEESCKKGKKCVKKEMCGDSRCPDPGYCWKCSN
jgi:hypothetical protein